MERIKKEKQLKTFLKGLKYRKVIEWLEMEGLEYNIDRQENQIEIEVEDLCIIFLYKKNKIKYVDFL